MIVDCQETQRPQVVKDEDMQRFVRDRALQARLCSLDPGTMGEVCLQMTTHPLQGILELWEKRASRCSHSSLWRPGILKGSLGGARDPPVTPRAPQGILQGRLGSPKGSSREP